MESAFSVKQRLSGFCRELGIPASAYPLVDHGRYVQDGVYFSAKPPYSFRVAERGTVISETVCKNTKEMYYGILKLLSYDIAIRREAAQRREGEDPRRQIFSVQYALLKNLDAEFGEMYLHDVDALLHVHPFHDPIGKIENGEDCRNEKRL